MRDLRLFRLALGLDIVHVSVFAVRALALRTQADREARSARADAVVAAAGFSLAVVALRRDAQAPVRAGLLLNTAGCVATLLLPARGGAHTRPAPRWWTTYLLIGGDAVSVAYLAASRSSHTRPVPRPRQRVRLSPRR